MRLSDFNKLEERVMSAGFKEEIDWQETRLECDDSLEFAFQIVWVIISSGMKNQVARKIEKRVLRAWYEEKPIGDVFRHKGKVKSIESVLSGHRELFRKYKESNDKLYFLEEIPFIGKITKYHLAKNLGHDVVKPDRHLVRIANQYNVTPDRLCANLAKQKGYRKSTIDIIIWRAANLGFI